MTIVDLHGVMATDTNYYGCLSSYQPGLVLPLLLWFPLCMLLVLLGIPVAVDSAGDGRGDPVKAVGPGSRGEGVMGIPVATEVIDPTGIKTPSGFDCIDAVGLPCPVAVLTRSSLPSFETA